MSKQFAFVCVSTKYYPLVYVSVTPPNACRLKSIYTGDL